VKAFLGLPLDHARYPYVFLDATYLHGRLGLGQQGCSRAAVIAMGVNADGRRGQLGLQARDSKSEGFWKAFIGSL
jgi:putative transposase